MAHLVTFKHWLLGAVLALAAISGTAMAADIESPEKLTREHGFTDNHDTVVVRAWFSNQTML